MTVKRNKIDLLSAFQPKQKAIVSSLEDAGAQANLAPGDHHHHKHSPLLAAGPLPGVSLDNASHHGKKHGEPVAMYASESEKRDSISLTNGDTGNILDKVGKHPRRDSQNSQVIRKSLRPRKSKIYDDPAVVAAYTAVPMLDRVDLPRGGLSIETQACGRIQFGIPPETIKDSMLSGLSVPEIYIVPVERFCREMGPALGINLAEFEFPAYFNYFVRGRKVTLVVDSDEAETNIRNVFSETLLGPGQFRNHAFPKANEEEDFDPSYPEDDRPNFYREFYHFRTAEKSTNYQELTIDTLIGFVHFQAPNQDDFDNSKTNSRIGVPIKQAEADEENEEKRREAKEKKRLRRILSESGHHLSYGGKTVRVKDNKVSGDDAAALGLPPTTDDHGKRQSFNVSDLAALSLHGLDGSTSKMKAQRRDSVGSASSVVSASSYEGSSSSWADAASIQADDAGATTRTTWMFSQVKWLGEVATIYPPDVTEEQKSSNDVKRVEIFKMPGGTEYVIHDVDENGIIIGKARFSGTVKVPDEAGIEAFFKPDGEEAHVVTEDDDDELNGLDSEGGSNIVEIKFDIPKAVAPPTFYPPSFGVTVLGNSHGFDKNGSTSGYVLWVNGRGIMIDPPPYSSSTLEREGIRPQMIVAIIITHCHADHDAGAFQKVLTGSRVAMITTPTIYKSFIRKYAALSGLSPTLLRHSHRHRPAIVGQPLRFQGAKFHFSYTLHTIPCIAFKVEWRGRSIVFTGDHLNLPPLIQQLEEKGVLTKGRSHSLQQIPYIDCDILLHEAGAPPIHTPIKVLQELPEEIKERLYVVHTSALPEDCELRVAPTGTRGTLRLDNTTKAKSGGSIKNQLTNSSQRMTESSRCGVPGSIVDPYQRASLRKSNSSISAVDTESLDDGGQPSLSVLGDYKPPSVAELSTLSLYTAGGSKKLPPMVFLRPTCVSDAWFILNLLSAVPFFSSLSYFNTMEVLEIAQVDLFCADEIVVPAHKRSESLCVVWEGTLAERDCSLTDFFNKERSEDSDVSSDTEDASTTPLHTGHVITNKDSLTIWHAGDWTGPVALQPDFERSADKSTKQSPRDIVAVSQEGVKVITLMMKDLSKILKRGSKLFRKYQAVKEKQVKEEDAMAATMARSRSKNETDEIERVRKLRGDNLLEVLKFNSTLGKCSAFQKRHLESIAEGPRFFDEGSYLWQFGDSVEYAFLIVNGTAIFGHRSRHDDELSFHSSSRRNSIEGVISRRGSFEFSVDGKKIEEDKLLAVPPNSEYHRLEVALQHRVEKMESDVYDHPRDMLPREELAQNARDRFANKVLARLYARQAYTSGLVFSRGHLLSDISRMVSGDLAYVQQSDEHKHRGHCHSSTMVAGRNGCVAWVFQRSSLVPFLEGNPGVLLMLLGTHAVV